MAHVFRCKTLNSEQKSKMEIMLQICRRIYNTLWRKNEFDLIPFLGSFVLSTVVTTTAAVLTIIILRHQSTALSKSDLQITHLRAKLWTDSTIKLEWKKPKYDVEKYHIYWSRDGHEERQFAVVDRDVSEAQLDDLIPGVTYRISVMTFVNWDIKQLESDSILVRTKPSTPGMLDRWKSHVNSDFVELTWEELTSFVESYFAVLQTCKGEELARKYTKSTEPSLYFRNPLTDTQYKVLIYAKANNQLSHPRMDTIQAKESDLQITNFGSVELRETTVTLKWETPKYDVVEKYVIHWSLGGLEQSQLVERDRTEVQLTSLTPGELYRISLTTYTHVECKLKSMVSESILVRTKPGVPGELEKTQVKSTSLDLKWTAPLGRVDEYWIDVMSDSGYRDTFEQQEAYLSIDNLEVNTLYDIKIYAISGYVGSDARTEKIKTKDIKVYWECFVKALLTGGITVAGLSFVGPAALGWAGFTAAGIGKGTLAASWMSWYGGSVSSGSLFSFLQSVGVVGLGAGAKAAIIASGMALGCITEVA